MLLKPVSEVAPKILCNMKSISKSVATTRPHDLIVSPPSVP